MNNLEEILRYSDNPKAVAKYFPLLVNNLEQNEFIERIEIEVSFTPKALVYTNQRILECKSRAFGTELEFMFWAAWELISDITINKGVLSDDIVYSIDKTNLFYTCENYPSSRMLDLEKFTNAKIATLSRNPINTQPVNSSDDDITQKLQKIQQLLANGLISESEFSAKKNQILDMI
ncbi:MAG: SHOCT domain-containing protein [Bacteroidales bacterium]|nr:SHOCT domain-containing protein [Bacteroidales bacterium]